MLWLTLNEHFQGHTERCRYSALFFLRWLSFLLTIDYKWTFNRNCYSPLLKKGLWIDIRHLGTSPTISSQLLKMPLGHVYSIVCVPQTDTGLSYSVVDSTHTAVAVWLLRLPVRRSETHYVMNSDIWRVVLTALNSFSWQSCLVCTSVTRALDASLTQFCECAI